jgi:catechol 2,3-dioxygenase-like lactoylglutathione lyase family enzyme
MTRPQALSIDRIVLRVGDMARSRAFYTLLGFEPADGDRLMLGGETIELALGNEAYPEPRAANDPWFQHFAIAVSDADAAVARLAGSGFAPISVGGAELLPPNTGSVIAYKFRDPDGHPLEFSYIPGSDWLANAGDRLFLGIDHTALAVSDLATSLKFYADLGFTEFGRSLNTGPEQDRLDGLDGIAVEIVALRPRGAGPHLELLHYLTPTGAPACTVPETGIAATRTVIRIDGEPATLLDPDGHRLDLLP